MAEYTQHLMKMVAYLHCLDTIMPTLTFGQLKDNNSQQDEQVLESIKRALSSSSDKFSHALNEHFLTLADIKTASYAKAVRTEQEKEGLMKVMVLGKDFFTLNYSDFKIENFELSMTELEKQATTIANNRNKLIDMYKVIVARLISTVQLNPKHLSHWEVQKFVFNVEGSYNKPYTGIENCNLVFDNPNLQSKRSTLFSHKINLSKQLNFEMLEKECCDKVKFAMEYYEDDYDNLLNNPMCITLW